MVVISEQSIYLYYQLNTDNHMAEFYNTNQTTGRQLEIALEAGKSQTDQVLELFKFWLQMTPSQCFNQYCRKYGHNTPIQSIRRAITNLKNAGHIIKTNDVAVGPYGANEHIYQIANQS